jgi:hypothetical protein
MNGLVMMVMGGHPSRQCWCLCFVRILSCFLATLRFAHLLLRPGGARQAGLYALLLLLLLLLLRRAGWKQREKSETVRSDNCMPAFEFLFLLFWFCSFLFIPSSPHLLATLTLLFPFPLWLYLHPKSSHPTLSHYHDGCLYESKLLDHMDRLVNSLCSFHVRSKEEKDWVGEMMEGLW